MRSALAATVTVVVWGACAGSAQSVDNRRVPNAAALTVDVRDYAHVPPPDLSRAVAEASRIFQGTGVRLVWRAERWPRLESARQGEPAGTNTIFVKILPRPLDGRIAVDPSILGAAPGADVGGRIAYLFSHRVEVAARRHGANYGALLGVVLAHELGHVLLKGWPHSQTGVMRAFCAGLQIHEMIAARGGFTAVESQAIRTRALTGVLE